MSRRILLRRCPADHGHRLCTRRNLLVDPFKPATASSFPFSKPGQDSCAKSKLTIALVPGWSMPATIWQNQIEAFSRAITLSLSIRAARASRKSRRWLHR